METEIIVALLGLCGTLSGSFFGVLAASKMTNYRLEQLEQRVNKHNNLIERMTTAEINLNEARKDVDVLFKRVRELEKGD